MDSFPLEVSPAALALRLARYAARSVLRASKYQVEIIPVHMGNLRSILILNLTSIGFTNFFRCLIFDLSFFTNADVVTIKDETPIK